MSQNENRPEIGNQIKHFREKRGMTQKELGEKCGIDAANIRKYESGKQNPKLSTLSKIADALGVTTLELTDPTLALFLYQGDSLASVYKPGEQASMEEWKQYKHHTESKLEMLELLNDESKEEKRLIDQIIKDFYLLTDEGQAKAAERVRELTEVPKYQNVNAFAFDQFKAEHTAPDAAGDAPDGTDTKE